MTNIIINLHVIPRHACVVHTTIYNLGTIQLRSIPFTSQNKLSHITINIGSNEVDASVSCLYDTCVVLSSEKIGYYQ